MSENRVKPTYYKGKSGKELGEYIEELGLDFNSGNIVKYLFRYEKKNGEEDLEKALRYSEMLSEGIDKKLEIIEKMTEDFDINEEDSVGFNIKCMIQKLIPEFDNVQAAMILGIIISKQQDQ